DYLRPETPEEALEALHQQGDEARILAGGQSLMILLNMRLARPGLLVDIARLEALAQCRAEGDALVIGAALTQAALDGRPSSRDQAPPLAQALPFIGHYQTRNRGTVCGSIAHADPSAELPLCLLALEGEVMLRSKSARRRVAAEQFFQSVFSTARQDDEMI